MTYILDACTVINLLHIDEDEFLFKKIRNLDIKLAHKVHQEINTNAYLKVKTLPSSDRSEYGKYLDIQIGFLRNYIVETKDYLFSEEDVNDCFNYAKKNGEFFSTLLALSLSREGIKKVFFVTDDEPAKIFFQPIMAYHQIGYIEDSVDLLTLLYWQNEDFKKVHFCNFLSKLFSEYAQQVSELLDKLRDYKTGLTQKHLRHPIRKKLECLIFILENLNFSNLKTCWNEILEENFSDLTELLTHYTVILNLESDSTSFLSKIRNTIQTINSNPIMTAFSKS